MPARSNEKQQIVEMLKALTAADGWHVTPSRMLPHSKLQDSLEVDVVAEKTDDGQTFTQSFEVVGKSRPATVEWVFQMLGKHMDLPTDRLFLVSWSGFTRNADRLARAYPDRVFPVVPRPVDHERSEGIAMFVEEITLSLKQYMVFSKDTDGPLRQLAIDANSVIRHADGRRVAHPEQVAYKIVHSPEFGTRTFTEAHGHPQRDTISKFEATVSLENNDLFLTQDQSLEKAQAIAAMSVRGEASWSQQRMDMTVREFGSHVFKHGRTNILGKPMIVVASLNDALEVVKVKAEPEKSTKHASGDLPTGDE